MSDNITLPREVVEQALEAWYFVKRATNDPDATSIITALRAALAAPRPEPMAWMRKKWSPDCGTYFDFCAEEEMGWRDRKEWTPLYAAPPAAAPRPEPERVEPTPPITRFTCGFVDVRFDGERWFCEMCGERMNEHYEEMVKHSNGKDYLELMQRKAAFNMGRDKT